MPEITPDLSDTFRCVSVHWSLPVQCVLPRTHADIWHEAWHPQSGNRIRYRRAMGVFVTEDHHDSAWHDLAIPAPGAVCGEPHSSRPGVFCQLEHGKDGVSENRWNHFSLTNGCRYSWNTPQPKALSVEQLTADVGTLRAHVEELHAALTQSENDLTGARLSLWEEEQDHRRTRTAFGSARSRAASARARVAELESERHSTNEALDDAVKAIRAKDERIAEFEAERDKLIRWHAEDTKQLAELEARIERRRMRLVEADADLQEMRGLLSPNGRPRRIPPEVEIHERVAPAVEWLLSEVERLTSERDRWRSTAERLAGDAGLIPKAAPAPARMPVPADSHASRLATLLSRKYDDVVTANPVDATTLDLTVEPADLARWDWWLKRIHTEPGQTTFRGSYATAKGHFGRTKVLLTGLSVGALYAAERAAEAGESQ